MKNKDFYLAQNIKSLPLKKQHKDLIGFCINRGSSSPCNIVQKWSCQVKSNPTWASTTSYQLNKIAKALADIKHWKVKYGDYKDLPNIEATWFIDPPYQSGGHRYYINDIDYLELANWCRTRKGQIIVCENEKANWLNFEPLKITRGQRKETLEVIYTTNNP